jgi:hypothetical protein
MATSVSVGEFFFSPDFLKSARQRNLPRKQKFKRFAVKLKRQKNGLIVYVKKWEYVTENFEEIVKGSIGRV